MTVKSVVRKLNAGVVALALASVAMTGVALAKVDVNRATAQQLQTLHGVGPARAQAIIVERRAHGPFRSAQDISARVPGIGAETVKGIAADIEFGSAAPAPRTTPAVQAHSMTPAPVHPSVAPPAAPTPKPPQPGSPKTAHAQTRKANPSLTTPPSGTPK